MSLLNFWIFKFSTGLGMNNHKIVPAWIFINFKSEKYIGSKHHWGTKEIQDGGLLKMVLENFGRIERDGGTIFVLKLLLLFLVGFLHGLV